jgi:hypothetical protein
LSGASEAGGGSETSLADAGKGGSLFAGPGFADSVLAIGVSRAFFFFLPACAVVKAG